MIAILGLGFLGAFFIFIPTVILHRIFKVKWYLKYIPAFLVLIISLILFRMAFIAHNDFSDLAYLVLSMILLISFFMSLIVLIAWDFKRLKGFLSKLLSRK